MTYMTQGAGAYRSESVKAAEYASPHELTGMLLDGALARIAQARGAIEQQQISIKGERIGKAISIIEGLRASLDHEAGGQIAANLARLYQYMEERLLLANLHNDAGVLAEVAQLLQQIKDGWEGIAPAEDLARSG